MVFVAIIMLTFIGSIVYVAVILLERRVLHYIPKRLGAQA
jgi:NitT/TauT family transport system permease protein